MIRGNWRLHRFWQFLVTDHGSRQFRYHVAEKATTKHSRCWPLAKAADTGALAAECRNSLVKAAKAGMQAICSGHAMGSAQLLIDTFALCLEASAAGRGARARGTAHEQTHKKKIDR